MRTLFGLRGRETFGLIPRKKEEEEKEGGGREGNFMCYLESSTVGRERSQRLKVFAALTEGLGSVPSTQGQQLTTINNSSPTRCDAIFWLLQVPAHTHIHTACTHNKQM